MLSASKTAFAGKVQALFNSNPVEFKPESVVLDVKGKTLHIPNDFVWIFAGGTPPNAFLKKIGVSFGARDLTLEAGKEVRLAAAEGGHLPDLTFT
jgi:thioredoxin reductase